MASASATEKRDRPPWIWPRAAYVHIPFCAHHCGYCDFAVATGDDDKIDNYIDALEIELATLQKPEPVATLSLGGGTPTHLNGKQLDRLLSALVRRLPLQADYEFSIEANPNTLDRGKVKVLADHGINRVSLGAQSFRPETLKVLEREHQPDDVPRAVHLVRERIETVSLDLIFGVPGQSLADWQADLQRALALRPDHVSTYGLTFEKGTRLWKQMREGRIQPLCEELELEMYLHAMDAMEAAGFEHYEISNFATPGRRSRHDQVYWANEAYFGFGMGAARYIHSRRELNTRNLTTYIRRLSTGQSPTFQSEKLSPADRARETIGLNLRRKEGIQRERFQMQTGFDLDALAGPIILHLVASGHLLDNGVDVRLSRQGKCVADAVFRQFWSRIK